MDHKDFNRDILKSGLKEGWSKWPSDSVKGKEMPLAQKPYDDDAKLIDLINPEEFKYDIKLQDAIKNRRTHRKFTRGVLTLKELSFLLWATQGITDEDVAAHRAVPSASARHPFETYLAIRNVKGLNPGIYRYLSLEHKLLTVLDGKEHVDTVANSCFASNKSHLEEAAVVFIWTTIPYRTEWRSGPYAYKFIAIDAGHLCQNLYLAVEAFGAGTCAIGAYDQEAIDKAIDVNGKDEFTIYIAPVGKVA